MKNIRKILLASFLVFFAIVTTSKTYADTPPPPPPEGGHGQGGSQIPGGGAPVGSGFTFLIALAAGYGAKKVYYFRKLGPAE
jgi:hypothetical protein